MIIGALLRPILERWGKAVDHWLQGLGFGFEKAYLSALAERHRHLKLVGVRGRTVVARPKLEDVYVSLQMGSPGSGSAAGATGPAELSVAEALQAHKRLVVLGEPGAGKTTMLRYLLLTFAGDIPQSRLGPTERRLPIYVRLKDFVNGERPICETLAVSPTLPVFKCPPGFFGRRLKRGRCIVLLDGLDELVDEGQKKAVAEKVGQMVRDFHPDNRYVVTCRTAGWDSNLLPGSFVALKIRDLNPAQVARFCHDWYKAVLTDERLSTVGGYKEKQRQARQEAATEAQRRADELVTALEAHEGLARLSKNPLILSLIALVHYHRHRLPQRRAQIYQDCLEVLLDQWDRDEHGLVLRDAPRPETKLAIVQEVAYHFQTGGEDEAGVEELSGLIAPILQAAAHPAQPDLCLKVQIAERSGLLVERAIGRYGFAHRALQEYLTAKVFAAVEEKQKELLAHLGEERWREVVLLYVGMVKAQATTVAREILARPDDPAQNLLLLAGQCLAEELPEDPIRVEESVRKECLTRLEAALRSTADTLLFTRLASVLAAIGGEDVVKYFERALRGEEGNVQVRLVAAESLGMLSKRISPDRIVATLLIALQDKQPVVRQAAAASLGQLGVARPEVIAALHAARQKDDDLAVRARAVGSLVRLGCAAELNLVRVPAGEFLIGSEEYSDERPPHRVYVDEYYISRYPVTNADFDRFAQAGGYNQKQWWTEAGWRWKGDRYGPGRYGGVFDRPNHPVTGVSWHEAMAYATWAAMRLPTEAEWEKAARGTDGRRWPWGNTFDTTRCNSGESWGGRWGLLTRFTTILRRPVVGRGTTPTVQYSPAGDSFYGVADMAGNVWEWTSSLYKPYPYKPDDGREDPNAEGQRVLRGGSWNSTAAYARSAVRADDTPGGRSDFLGFRCVVVPPGSPPR